MKAPKTESEALSQSIMVWVEIAQERLGNIEDEGLVCEYLLGYSPKNNCPLCEYTKDENNQKNCKKCPASEWRDEAKKRHSAPCQDSGPYREWADGDTVAAWDMVELLSEELRGLAFVRGE